VLPIIWHEWHSIFEPVHSLEARLPEFAMKRQRVQMPTEACVTKLEPLFDWKSQSVQDPEERYIIRKAPPFVAPLSTRLLASSLPTLCATSKIPPRCIDQDDDQYNISMNVATGDAGMRQPALWNQGFSMMHESQGSQVALGAAWDQHQRPHLDRRH
jgi:hypothetical protein